jgi:hypothetical protein
MKMLDCFKAFAMAIAIATAGDVCANENNLLIGYPLITSFKFSYESIGWEGDGYWEGIIDYKSKIITFATQKWIENIDKLPAIFELDGDGVAKVGGKVQFSGATVNDFRKDVVYTVGDAEYTVKFVSPQASGLPVIRIDTKNGVEIVSKENWVTMTFALTDPNNSENNMPTISNNDIRGRGNESWTNQWAKKKSYRVRFGSKKSLFGLEAARNWVLHAQYRDETLLYNTIAFELGNHFGLPFNHSFNFVELYMNGLYKGNYLLTEHNQVNKGRVDIDEERGWLVEISGYYDLDEDPKFKTTSYDLPIVIKSPEFEPADINNPAYDFVRNDWSTLADAVASPTFPENGYRDLINMDTFIAFLMIQEITNNSDFGSTYSYKDKNDMVNMGPLWDFDCGYGFDINKLWSGVNVHYNSPNTRWTFETLMLNNNSHAKFFSKFFQDPIFLAKYKEKWNKMYYGIVSIPDFIDDMARKLEKSAKQNFQTWWYKTYAPFTNTREPQPNDFSKSISSLKNWYNTHVSYLNSELNKVEVLPQNKTFTAQVFGYTEIAPQTFTLVSYGDMKNLSATLKKQELSGFDVSTKLSKTTTGNGGYLVTISVKPKNSLPAETYTDTLILSGINQAQWFSIKVPLAFAVNEAAQPAPEITSIYKGGNAAANRAVQTRNGINLAAANNATLEIFNLKGSLISRQSFSGGVHAIQLGHLPKGIYIVKVSFGGEKQILRVPVR